MSLSPLTGLWPPAATPFNETGAVDTTRLVAHGRAMIADGAKGLAILGTTSEANSLGLDERRRVIDACVASGIAASQLLPGTGSASLADAIALTRHAAALGSAGVLLLPPFYYKGVTDAGVFAFIAKLIEGCGAQVPRVLLYHIPQQTAVGFSLELIAKLIAAFPGVVVGMKDSSGDFPRIKGIIEAFPGFAVFPGAETHAVAAMAAGAVGCISATANINARAIATLVREWQAPDAGRRQDDVNAVRRAAEARGLISSVKVVLAERYRDPAWRSVRPPLLPLDEAGRAALLADPAIAGLFAAA
ncbi:MAG: dihydrodipicolinate synthase family protein [Bauldia sp.]